MYATEEWKMRAMGEEMEEDGGFWSEVSGQRIFMYTSVKLDKKYVLGHGAHIRTVTYKCHRRMEDGRYERNNGGR